MTTKTIKVDPLITASDGSPIGQAFYAFASGGDRQGLSDVGEHRYDAKYEEYLAVGIERISLGSRYLSSTWASHPSQGYCDYPVNKASAGMYAKVIQSDFNAGVFAGEFRETVGTIVDLTRRLSRAVAAVKGLSPKALAKAVSGHRPGQSLGANLGDNWLLYKYGIMPLLLDIRSAYKLLTHTYQNPVKVSSAAREPFKYFYTRSNDLTWTYESKCIAEVRATVDMQVSLADRLGLTDPLSIAWELTKLSFVVDWMIPIGNFLAAVNARRKVRFTDNVWITLSDTEHWRTPSVYTQWAVQNPALWHAYRKITYVRRYPSTALPLNMPSIQNPLGDSVDRYFSAMALLSQAVRR